METRYRVVKKFRHIRAHFILGHFMCYVCNRTKFVITDILIFFFIYVFHLGRVVQYNRPIFRVWIRVEHMRNDEVLALVDFELHLALCQKQFYENVLNVACGYFEIWFSLLKVVGVFKSNPH